MTSPATDAVSLIPPTIEWVGGDTLATAGEGAHVELIDQRLLPGELVMVEARTIPELCEYIATLAVLGIAASASRK